MMTNSSDHLIVELRNWKEDNGHHKDTFSFAKLDG